MPLPASGIITLNDVNVELGLSGTAQIGMDDAAVRGLFGIASGEIQQMAITRSTRLHRLGHFR